MLSQFYILRKTDMFNTTKALLTLTIVIITIVIILGIWLITPQHSGVALATSILGLPVPAVLVGWVYDL